MIAQGVQESMLEDISFVPSAAPKHSIVIKLEDPESFQRTLIVTDNQTGRVKKRIVSVPSTIEPNRRNEMLRAKVQRGAAAIDADVTDESDAPQLERIGMHVRQFGHDLGQSAFETLPETGAFVGASLSAIPGPVGSISRGLKSVGPVAFRKLLDSKMLRPIQDRTTADVTMRSVPAAGLGAAGGEAVQRAVTGESTFGDTVQGSLKELQHLAQEGAYHSLFEAGAGVLGKAVGVVTDKLRRVLAPNPAELTEVSKTAGEVLSEAAEAQAKRTGEPVQGTSLSFGERLMDPATGEVKRVQLLTLIETALQDFPFSSKVFQTPRLINQELLQGEAARMVEFVERRGGIEDVVRLLVSEASGTQAGTRKIISKLYKRLGKMTAGVPVSTEKTGKFLTNLSDKQRPGVDTVVDMIRSTDNAAEAFKPLAEGASVYERLLGGADISFSEAGTLRSELLAFARKSSNDPATIQAQSVASKVAQVLSSETETAAKKLSPSALRFFQQVKQFTKDAHGDILTGRRKRGEFSETSAALAIPAIDSIAKDPGKAASVLLKKDNHATIAGIKKLAPTKWPLVKDALVDDIFLGASNLSAPTRAGGPPVRELKGVRLRDKLDNLGDPMLVELLGPQGALRLRRLADAMAIVDQKVKGLGKVAMSLMAFGVISGAAGTIYATDVDPYATVGSVAMVTLGPNGVARLVRSPRMMALLEKGFKSLGDKDPTPGIKLLNRVSSHLNSDAERDFIERKLEDVQLPKRGFLRHSL